MIDLRALRENPDVLRASQRARGEDESVVESLLSLDEERRSALTAFEQLRAEQKASGKLVSRAQGEEKQALIAQGKEMAQQVKDLEARAAELGAELEKLLKTVPNLVEEGAPAGGEQDYVVLEHVGELPVFDFTPRDHLELGELLGAIDMERGAKISGSRFYFLTGVGMQLQMALLNLAMEQAIEAGFTPMYVPVMVKPETMEGTGFLGNHSSEVYHLPADDLYLVGTSEVGLAGYHMDEILAEVPKRYVGWSSCFRREAGSYGKDTRGIIRVHQFDKVEMFTYVDPADAHEEHQRLLAWEKEMLAKCELPFRVIDTAAGDLGTSAARKFDCEAWVPTQEAYRELTSTSNCTTFQSRRLSIRFKDGEGRTAPVATLNGTLATTRWIVAILENHQQADGSVRVPKALQRFIGKEVLTPVK
ncbi:serine--tRNA ligase [Actinocorallia longicatena]|uniref:Serine--tRNA ligase n=1 Tax=Actinocorallia longicatena TaxID=111803 RepID=A0ABP6QCH3_9ACTN